MEKRELTQIQKDWILDTFFGIWEYKYAGVRDIGNALIESGFCYVPGNECIFDGYIGNFISTSVDDNCIGGLKYEFNFNFFIDSEYFYENKVRYCELLSAKIDKLNNNIKEISAL